MIRQIPIDSPWSFTDAKNARLQFVIVRQHVVVEQRGGHREHRT